MGMKKCSVSKEIYCKIFTLVRIVEDDVKRLEYDKEHILLTKKEDECIMLPKYILLHFSEQDAVGIL